jgi:hypothetical protein
MNLSNLKKTESNHYIFPDTKEGAKAYLLSDFDGELTDKTQFIQDPYVPFVWKVTNVVSHNHEYDAIVYLTAGRKDNLTRCIQQMNDYELIIKK